MSISVLAAALATQQPTQSSSIEGLWHSPGGNSTISIASCGSTFCGTVAWASQKAQKDAAKATDQLIGTQLLTDVQQDLKGKWRGRLFIPDKNMRVIAKLQPVGQDQLKVSGCAAGRSLCKSTLWTRFDEPLPVSD